MPTIECPSRIRNDANQWVCADPQTPRPTAGGTRPNEADCIACKRYPGPWRAKARYELLNPTVNGIVTPPPKRAPIPSGGPGSEIEVLIETLGLDEFIPKTTCGCVETKEQMNVLGVVGCRLILDNLVTIFQEKLAKTKIGPVDWIRIVGRAAFAGLVFRIDMLNPVKSIVEEAIRRAEQANLAAV